ncbi:hypothetical protein G6F57_015003 [Rhizopus arrhizus]|nr:hypothetical protein G6F57_015003 [Rhizopus arrhizus]
MNWLNEVLNNDPNPVETQEWIESLKAVIDVEGSERAHQLLEGMVELTRRSGAYLPFSPTTEYVNTIAPQLEAKSPGNAELEWRIRSIIRWNAMATVVRANRKPGDLGGHIASFASGATLATAPRASTRVPSWKAASAKSSWTSSAWKWTAVACPRTRTRG